MTGGNGGPVIIGRQPLIEVLEEEISLVADFRKQRLLELLEKYDVNENSITREDVLFLLRCANDVAEQTA